MPHQQDGTIQDRDSHALRDNHFQWHANVNGHTHLDRYHDDNTNQHRHRFGGVRECKDSFSYGGDAESP